MIDKTFLSYTLQRLRKLETTNIPHSMIDVVTSHFNGRGRVWPTVEDGLLFTQTELSEAVELLLAKKNYRRNNPENKEKHTKERFAEELGDVIYMAIITGIVENVNPVEAMFNKMKRQINKELEK